MTQPHNYRSLYMSDPVYLNESDAIDVYLERKNNTTGVIEPASGLTNVTVSYTATTTGSAISSALSVPLTERSAAPGFYYGVVPGAAKAASLTVGQRIYAKISDGGVHIDVTRPLVVRQVRDTAPTTLPGTGVITIVTPPPPPPPPPDVTDTTPASVTVSVAASALNVGGSTSATAVVRNAAGGVIAGTVAFHSSNTSVATIDSGTGAVSAIAAGSASITATINALTSNAVSLAVSVVAVQDSSTVDLPTTTLTTTVASTPTGGSTIHVASGGDLQAALDAAVPGDTITLEAGAVWTGNYAITPRSGGISGAWIFVTSDGSLPAEGTRMTSARAVTYNLPKIRSISGASASLSASGAVAKFRFIGIAITPDPSLASMNTIVNLGTGNETTLAAFPSDLIFDRCYIAGHDTLECRRGVTLNSYRTAIIDGSVAEIHSTGFDSQAILGWNGPGVYKIENNYLEASTEIIAFGGADPAYVGHNPSDIVIRRNYITRPMAWKGGQWLIKNMIEPKCGVRIDIDSNVIENSWPAAQLGWVGVFWSVNQNGGNPTVETGHVTFRNNVIRNCAAGFQITDGFHGTGYVAGTSYVPAHHIAIYNNVFIGNDNPTIDNGTGALGLYIGTAVDNVSFEHNTFMWPATTTSACEIVVGSGRCANLSIRNNIMGGGNYPFYTLSANWAAIVSGTSHFDGNVFGFTNADYYASTFALPAGNFYPATPDVVGFAGGGSKAFDVTATLADLTLLPTSPYAGIATDGTNPGADMASIATAVSGVGGGF